MDIPSDLSDPNLPYNYLESPGSGMYSRMDGPVWYDGGGQPYDPSTWAYDPSWSAEFDLLLFSHYDARGIKDVQLWTLDPLDPANTWNLLNDTGYFNTYGARQSLSNPYTGVAAIFAARLLNDNPPVIYEDGEQTRDFIHVNDIIQANLLAMKQSGMDFSAFNVGSGQPVTIREVAEMQRDLLDANVKVDITGQFRAGDIRHCFADTGQISQYGFEPQYSFSDGVADLVSWQKEQAADDHFERARVELARRGLT